MPARLAATPRTPDDAGADGACGAGAGTCLRCGAGAEPPVAAGVVAWGGALPARRLRCVERPAGRRRARRWRPTRPATTGSGAGLRLGLRLGLDDAGEPDLTEGRRDHGGTGGRGGRDGHGVERGRRSGRRRSSRGDGGLGLLAQRRRGGREAERGDEATGDGQRRPRPCRSAWRNGKDSGRQRGERVGAHRARGGAPEWGWGTCMDLSRRLRGELSGSGGGMHPAHVDRLAQRCPAADACGLHPKERRTTPRKWVPRSCQADVLSCPGRGDRTRRTTSGAPRGRRAGLPYT